MYEGRCAYRVYVVDVRPPAGPEGGQAWSAERRHLGRKTAMATEEGWIMIVLHNVNEGDVESIMLLT